MRPGLVIIFIWLGLGLSWYAASLWSRKAETRLGLRAELPYRVILLVGAVILGIPAHGYDGPLRLWMVTRDQAWICTALVAVGALICWWAPSYLGSLLVRHDHQKDRP